MKYNERIIGRFGSGQNEPLLIAIAAMHGNEKAGVLALEKVFELLEIEIDKNPGFTFIGNFIGLIGNLKGLQQNKRFLAKDLNRLWTVENVAQFFQQDPSELKDEDAELIALLDSINEEIERSKPERIVIIDLHTTSARGGIFSIATDAPESIRIAIELHAPVITGMLSGLGGTTLHYFNPENTGLPITAVAFEAGHHENPLSVNRCVSAIVNCMRTIGCVKREDVEHHHDTLLLEYSKGLPKIAELLAVHKISFKDQFVMKPGYKNFQRISKGEELAIDRNGPVLSPYDGLILMPLYQPQGAEGFFIVREIG